MCKKKRKKCENFNVNKIINQIIFIKHFYLLQTIYIYIYIYIYKCIHYGCKYLMESIP